MTETSAIPDRRAEARESPERRRHPRDLFVEFKDVYKSYGTKQVLRGVDLKVYRGEVLVILGGSGSGKSVTLRHMLGLEAPDSGRVFVEEEDITDHPEEELYRVRKKFGMLFQSGALFDSMTVFENVAFPLREHANMSEEEIARAVREKLELVNLPNTERLMPVDLSGGMRKRVGLARSIVLDPKMILYDEPTTGLDPITSQKINELIIDLQSKLNVTSVVVTHDIQSAFSVGDRVAFLNKGVFEWVGTMEQARDSEHPVLREFLKASAVLAAQPTGQK
ncbi:MAG: phospholipid/cholesterol/gamma-HCH transport system ATP-binding protein [Thermoanaerobaculia bacterium]|jgi:phospholipid/cholesterol/gamma-HCH transport system ATP-binding protein|nr:phospholipid/cholesterol/gamma-HCH transport system ATP-binding protein [Thermoanaerobaculia bacterium]